MKRDTRVNTPTVLEPCSLVRKARGIHRRGAEFAEEAQRVKGAQASAPPLRPLRLCGEFNSPYTQLKTYIARLCGALLCALACAPPARAIGRPRYVEFTATPGALRLVAGGVAAPILLDSQEYPGVPGPRATSRRTSTA